MPLKKNPNDTVCLLWLKRKLEKKPFRKKNSCYGLVCRKSNCVIQTMLNSMFSIMLLNRRKSKRWSESCTWRSCQRFCVDFFVSSTSVQKQFTVILKVKLNLTLGAVEVRWCWKVLCLLWSSGRLSSLSLCCLISFLAAELGACTWEMHFHNEVGRDEMGAFASKLRKQELNSFERGSELPSCCWDAVQLCLFRVAEPQEEKLCLCWLL